MPSRSSPARCKERRTRPSPEARKLAWLKDCRTSFQNYYAFSPTQGPTTPSNDFYQRETSSSPAYAPQRCQQCLLSLPSATTTHNHNYLHNMRAILLRIYMLRSVQSVHSHARAFCLAAGHEPPAACRRRCHRRCRRRRSTPAAARAALTGPSPTRSRSRDLAKLTFSPAGAGALWDCEESTQSVRQNCADIIILELIF